MNQNTSGECTEWTRHRMKKGEEQKAKQNSNQAIKKTLLLVAWTSQEAFRE